MLRSTDLTFQVSFTLRILGLGGASRTLQHIKFISSKPRILSLLCRNALTSIISGIKCGTNSWPKLWLANVEYFSRRLPTNLKPKRFSDLKAMDIQLMLQFMYIEHFKHLRQELSVYVATCGLIREFRPCFTPRISGMWYDLRTSIISCMCLCYSLSNRFCTRFFWASDWPQAWISLKLGRAC